jgi:hypothetical protein
MHSLAARPAPSEYVPYYHSYVSLVPDGDILATLARQCRETFELLGDIPESHAGFRYAPGKWSIREMVGHLIDGERIFAYRALRFARNDSAPLHGFDEEEYIRNAAFDTIPLPELAREYRLVREATVLLFKHLEPAAWDRTGIANNGEASVRAIAWIMAGHELHHLKVLRERYLSDEMESP